MRHGPTIELSAPTTTFHADKKQPLATVRAHFVHDALARLVGMSPAVSLRSASER
jgi:hypothetical protein